MYADIIQPIISAMDWTRANQVLWASSDDYKVPNKPSGQPEGLVGITNKELGFSYGMGNILGDML